MKRLFLILKIIVCGGFLSFVSPSAAQATEPLTASRDSLIRLLNSTTDNQRKLELLTHLSDIDMLQDKYDYTLQLWNLAIRLDDQDAISTSVRPLTLRYSDVGQLDSTDVWIGYAKTYLKGQKKESLVQYLEMLRDIRDLTKREELARKLLKEEQGTTARADKYNYMRRLYCLGAIALMNDEIGKKLHLQPWDSYMKEGLEIAKSIPLEQDFLFQTQFLLALSSTDIQYTKQLIAFLQRYRQLPHVKSRIFNSHRTEIRAIAHMLTHGEEIGREQMDSYFKEFKRMMKAYPQDMAPPYEFYYPYVAENYYSYIQDYEKVVDCCDSVIKYAPKYKMDCVTFYEDKSRALAALGRWKEAYAAATEYIVVKDSLEAQNAATELMELQTQYEVNKLELEKTHLIARQQKRVLAFIIVLLLITVGWSIYIYRTLRVTRRLKQHLEIQSNKAIESEKMKTIFLNSISHEIRTPLNGIQGFCELILEDEVDPDLKPVIKDTISKNVDLLTALIDDLLEISKLSSATGTVPKTPVSIEEMCTRCMENEKQAHGKESIEYRIDDSCKEVTFLTNQLYLSKVLSNLLGNANKFTTRGSITISCRLKEKDSRLILAITDTGKGIPAEKQEWIFNAFTKIDEFIPGTGLGLYVCREIIKRLDGKIYIDPSYKDGTRVIVELVQ